MIIMEKTLVDRLLVPTTDAMPPNFGEKTFANGYKTLKFAKVFSLNSFPLCGSPEEEMDIQPRAEPESQLGRSSY